MWVCTTREGGEHCLGRQRAKAKGGGVGGSLEVGGALGANGEQKDRDGIGKRRDWKVGWDKDTAGLEHQVKKFDLCLLTN